MRRKASENIRLIEVIIAASVVVISLASLFVAVYQGRVMERTMRASVWPVLHFDHGNRLGERSTIYFQISNDGIGPAEIRHIVYRLGDDTLRSPQSFLGVCCGEDSGAGLDWQAFTEAGSYEHMDIVTAPVVERVLSANEDLIFFRFDQPEQDVALSYWRAVDTARWGFSIEVYYCSVFEECWVVDSRRSGRRQIRAQEIDRLIEASQAASNR